MNLVFMNSLEKKTADERVKTAQVAIHEDQGQWQVTWLDTNGQGEAQQEVWFTGGRWDEMLAKFKMHLAEKMSQGYVPLLEGYLDTRLGGMGRSALTQMIHYYSEQHEVDVTLMEQLKQWRRERSAKEGKAPYLLATNRVLQLICTYIPHTVEELKQIPGMGSAKVDTYGKEIVELLANVKRTHDFPLDWVMETVDREQFRQWVYKQKEESYRKEWGKREGVKKLLAGMAEGRGLDELVQTLSVPRRDVVQWVEELEEGGYDLGEFLERQLAGIAAEVRTKAFEAFRKHGDRYLKPVLQELTPIDQLSEKDRERKYEELRLLRLQFRRNRDSASQAS